MKPPMNRTATPAVIIRWMPPLTFLTSESQTSARPKTKARPRNKNAEARLAVSQAAGLKRKANMANAAATATKAAGILFEEAVKEYTARHRVKPGITGWAQINGYRGETDTLEKIEKRVEYDLQYIENWSVWFDLYILFRTLPAVIFTREAY